MNILFWTQKTTFAEGPYPKGRVVGGAQAACGVISKNLACRNHKVHYLASNEETTSLIKSMYSSFSNDSLNLHIANYWKPKKFDIFSRTINYILYKFYYKNLLYKLLTLHKWDIVYTCLPSFVYEAQKFIDGKVILRIANYHWAYGFEQDPIQVAEYCKLMKAVDAVHLLTAEQEDFFFDVLNKYNIEPIPTTIVGDVGIEIPMKEIIAPKANNEMFKIGCIARFDNNQKRQDLLLYALPTVLSYYNVQLVFIGDGPLRERMEEEAHRLGIKEYVQFYNYIPNNKIGCYYHKFDLFCLPTNSEGNSKTVLEAMAYGLPVLVSDVQGLSHLKNGVTVFKVRNMAESWAKYILHIIDHPEERYTVAANGADYVEKQFNAAVNITYFEKSLYDLLPRSVK